MNKSKSRRSRLELSDDLKKELDSFSKILRKEVSGRKGPAKKGVMIKVAKWLRDKMERKTYHLLSEALFEVAKGQENVYLERYVRSLYFSGDYERFKRLHPVDIVKMVRYYFKKKDGTPKIPVEYAPLLLKLARNVKASIRNTIKYRGKGSFIPEEAIFEELKKEYLEEKKYFYLKKKKKKKKKEEKKKAGSLEKTAGSFVEEYLSGLESSKSQEEV